MLQFKPASAQLRARMIIVSAQALIARHRPLVHIGYVIIRLGHVIISQPAMIIETAFTLIAVPQKRLSWPLNPETQGDGLFSHLTYLTQSKSNFKLLMK
ncbi:hypothetical protein [Sporosarcina cascadiensis]|uniref:hypothetical protein n=1 Tax=Sporosarcina cascadiensis TaxID=2660747 RepID=UPI00129BB4D4|nr:hypothetical protein [Sporosarcina cascadiensis]